MVYPLGLGLVVEDKPTEFSWILLRWINILIFKIKIILYYHSLGYCLHNIHNIKLYLNLNLHTAHAHTYVHTYTHTDTYITEIVKMQGTCALQSIEIYAVMCTGIRVCICCFH